MIERNALGLGLRVPHYRDLLDSPCKVDYFEIIAENFFSNAALPQRVLREVSRRYPVVIHGVGLNLLGHEDLDERYIDSLARLADQLDSPWVTDHLCWGAAHGIRHHDLLPTPFREDLADYAAERAAYVQKRLGRPFGLENLSSYVAFDSSTMSEWDFYQRVVQDADVYALLDVNNVWVSATNHGFSPHSYLQAVNFSRVLEVHIAGHNATGPIVIDTHDRAVQRDVWELYRYAWKLGGPFPTLLEWDADQPPLADAVAELARAHEFRQ